MLCTVWTGIKSVLSAALNTIKNVTNTVLSWFGTNWKKIWNGIKSFTSGLWNGLKSLAAKVFNGIKTAILTPIRAVKSGLSSLWNGIKSTASSVWRSIKSTASSIWSSIKTAVTSPVQAIKSTLSSAWGSIKSAASSAWSNIKNAMISPINSAKSTISGIISKIKGFFPLSIGRIFSNLKLPHISVSGGKAPFGIGGKGSLPSFSVSWYAKAMDEPFVLNNATIFGAMNGNLLGGGERGSEVVVGTRKLMEMIADAKGGNQNVVINVYAAEGQNVNDLAEQIAYKLEDMTRRKAVANGTI